MQQNHGEETDLNYLEWDRLAIVVDKTQKPYQAKYYQFKGGDLKLASANEQSPFRARCFACHANGPRAIRPNNQSERVPLRLKDKVKIFWWNLRIKSYGQVIGLSGQKEVGEVKFKSSSVVLNKSLNLKSCIACHGSGKIRAGLTLEHLDTMKFLVSHNIMPPFPFNLSTKDKAFFEQMKLKDKKPVPKNYRLQGFDNSRGKVSVRK